MRPPSLRFRLGLLAPALMAILVPMAASAEPADALCVYLGLACGAPAPRGPTLLPGPLYLPALPAEAELRARTCGERSSYAYRADEVARPDPYAPRPAGCP
jgi:hypothetical protein